MSVYVNFSKISIYQLKSDGFLVEDVPVTEYCTIKLGTDTATAIVLHTDEGDFVGDFLTDSASLVLRKMYDLYNIELLDERIPSYDKFIHESNSEMSDEYYKDALLQTKFEIFSYSRHMNEIFKDANEIIKSDKFEGFDLDSQVELFDMVFSQAAICDTIEKRANLLNVYLNEWTKKSFEYQHKYLCWRNIYRLPFLKRLKFLFNPFSIEWDDVKDFDYSYEKTKQLYKLFEK